MLFEEYLKPAGLTQSAAAERMGIPLNRLNEIVRGRRAITADTRWTPAGLLGVRVLSRRLVFVGDARGREITMVLNWVAELERLMLQ